MLFMALDQLHLLFETAVIIKSRLLLLLFVFGIIITANENSSLPSKLGHSVLWARLTSYCSSE